MVKAVLVKEKLGYYTLAGDEEDWTWVLKGVEEMEKIEDLVAWGKWAEAWRVWMVGEWTDAVYFVEEGSANGKEIRGRG